ncbi:MAG: hypothetical protein IM638_17895 [Bacteroidetes bacterium]|nr:hypothetical protein [Bacteroidota bacterium]
MSEKRYYKIWSSRHIIGSQNKYISLFDALDSQVEENDVLLKVELKKQNINVDYLSADKNYLYHHILKSLNSFHSSKSLSLEIKEILISVEILFSKGIYDQCLKLIKRAKGLALSIENFQLLLDILVWERKCLGYSQGIKVAYQANKEISVYSKQAVNQKKYSDIFFRIALLRQRYNKGEKSIVFEKLKKIMDNPLLENEENALSFSALVRFHQIYSLFYFIKDDKEKELVHTLRLIDLIDSNEIYWNENPLDYVTIYSRLLALKRGKGRKEIEADLRKMRAFPDRVKISRQTIIDRVFVYSSMSELAMLIEHKDFSSGYVLIKGIALQLEKIATPMEKGYYISMYYMFGYICFAMGKFHESLKYFNHVINSFKEDQRPDIYYQAKLLGMLNQYELGNYELLGYQYNSVYNFYRKRRRLYETEKVVLGFLKQAEGAHLNHTIQHLLTELHKSLNEIAVNSFERNALNLFDFTFWAQARIKGKTMNEFSGQRIRQ